MRSDQKGPCDSPAVFVQMTIRWPRLFITVVLGSLITGAAPASAQDRLCDPANENCRSILINLIRNETVGIDVAFWFMEDARYTAELISRHRAGYRSAC